MATQKIYWECNTCKRLYDEQDQAKACEQHHAELADIKIVDYMDTDADANTTFPEKILLQDPQRDGVLAEYQFCQEGDLSQFYQNGNYFYQPESKF